jgi:trk system potassium uptake protein TrkA
MASILVLGLGSFGITLARDLVGRGNEVAVVDASEDRVNAVKDEVDKAIIADATQRAALEEIGVADFDTVVVNLGDRIDASVLTTLHLKQLGARRVVVKGVSEDHVTVAKMVGADQVVFPERDIALRLSYVLTNPNVLERILLAPNYSLVELAAPDDFTGKTLSELDLRNQYEVQVVILKRAGTDEVVFPTRDLKIGHRDVLVLMGRDVGLRRIQAL